MKLTSLISVLQSIEDITTFKDLDVYVYGNLIIVHRAYVFSEEGKRALASIGWEQDPYDEDEWTFEVK